MTRTEEELSLTGEVGGALLFHGVHDGLKCQSSARGSEFTKVETKSESVYRIKHKRGGVDTKPLPGPNTTKVVVDKASGDIDVREFYLGCIPAQAGTGPLQFQYVLLDNPTTDLGVTR